MWIGFEIFINMNDRVEQKLIIFERKLPLIGDSSMVGVTEIRVK